MVEVSTTWPDLAAALYDRLMGLRLAGLLGSVLPARA